MLELGEHECCVGEVADLLRARGDVLQYPPATNEQSKAAFADTTQRAQQRIVGAVVDAQLASVGGLLERSVHADTRAGVSRVGQRGQSTGGRGVQRAEGV